MEHDYEDEFDGDDEDFDEDYDHPEDDEDFGNVMEDDEDDFARKRFADPGGESSLYRASPGNPRIHPCGTCGSPNRLTARDLAAGYQCDACADRAERGGY